MTESDTEFLSRMFSQSAVPQGQAADPDMTRLLALAAEAVRLRDALEWYADPERYKPHPHGPAFERGDLSFKAVAALSQKESTP